MDFSTQVIKVLDELGKKFGVAIDWSNKNVTPYIKDLGHRIVKLEIAEHTLWLIAWSIVLIVSLYILHRIHKEFEEINGWVSALIVISVLLCGSEVYRIVECNVLPEAVVIEKINETVHYMNDSDN